MKVKRIELEGREGRHASITHSSDRRRIEVLVVTPYQPEGRVHQIAADADEDELWNQAANLQRALDGVRGTGGDIDDYYRELQRFAD